MFRCLNQLSKKSIFIELFFVATIRNKALASRRRLLRCSYIRHERNNALESVFPPNLLLRIVAGYELSPVTNCRLLRIVACCELSPHSVFFAWFSKLSPKTANLDVYKLHIITLKPIVLTYERCPKQSTRNINLFDVPELLRFPAEVCLVAKFEKYSS